MKSGINQLIATLLGTLIVTGYLIYESLLFAAPIWFIWIMFNVGALFGLGQVEYLQVVGLLFAFKMFRFESSKLSQKAVTPIIIPKENLSNENSEDQDKDKEYDVN